MMKMMYRQGDVLLHTADAIPQNVTEVPRDPKRGVVLAEGEVTGHAHRILSRHAVLYRTETDARYLRVSAGAPAADAQLWHDEHKTRCRACPEHPLTRATHYDSLALLGPELESQRYSCPKHASPGDVALHEPGATVLSPGTYRITIDGEYVPGELPRNTRD